MRRKGESSLVPTCWIAEGRHVLLSLVSCLLSFCPLARLYFYALIMQFGLDEPSLDNRSLQWAFRIKSIKNNVLFFCVNR